MGVEEIPQSFVYKCDGCGKPQVTPTKRRPAHWAELRLAQDAYDFQGCAVADGTIERLLCSDCTQKVVDAINAILGVRS